MNETPLPFGSLEFRVAWDEWLQYRKERRLPKYTSIGLKRTFTKLVKDSNNDECTAIAILDQSLSQNWAGLFPLKSNQNGNKINWGPSFAGNGTIQDRSKQIITNSGFGQL